MIEISDVHRLISQPGADHTLSLYLTTDPSRVENQGATLGWRIWLKNGLRELSAAHPGDATYTALCGRAEALLEDYRGRSKALALFLTPHAEQLFELPVPLAESSASYGRAALAPLLWLMDEYERTLIVIVDHERARFISGYMGVSSREGQHTDDFVAHEYPERSGHNQAASAADHQRHFMQGVAEHARRLKDETGAERLILGGNDEVAHALKHALHESVARAVVAIVPIPQRADDREVVRLALPFALAYERQREVELVDQAIDFAKSGGPGALGMAAVAACLERKQVELLMLAWPIEDAEQRERLLREAMAAGAKIELVSGVAAERVRAEGGAVARLFYVVGHDAR
jgi:hypothetical protein